MMNKQHNIAKILNHEYFPLKLFIPEAVRIATKCAWRVLGVRLKAKAVWMRCAHCWAAGAPDYNPLLLELYQNISFYLFLLDGVILHALIACELFQSCRAASPPQLRRAEQWVCPSAVDILLKPQAVMCFHACRLRVCCSYIRQIAHMSSLSPNKCLVNDFNPGLVDNCPSIN